MIQKTPNLFWKIKYPYNSNYLIAAIIAIISIVVLDLYSKWAIFEFLLHKDGQRLEITSFFNLVTVWNRGVSFGMFRDLSNGPTILTCIGILISIYLFCLIWLEQNKMMVAALAMIIGGAVGNIADRIINGAVADFLDVHFLGYHWPAFNVADSFITCGVVLYLVADLFFKGKRNGN